jgi:DNA primase
MSKKTPFVSFKAVKQAVSMAQVLDRYGLAKTLAPRGKDSLTGPCPIHHGANPTQFRVSPSKNIWNCFGGCPGGNVLDFVAQMEKVDIRQAAILLSEWFSLAIEGKPKQRDQRAAWPSAGMSQKEVAPVAEGPQGGPVAPSRATPPSEEVPRQVGATAREEPPQAQELAVITANAPLPFAGLKNLDGEHESLERMGITRQTADYFGAGYCRKGMMKDRLAIPIHNPKGELLAYAGRAVGEGTAATELYKYPPAFRRDLEVYNLNRAFWSDQIEGEGVIVVPDFLDVFAIYEAGYDNAVALMGSELSEAQALLLVRTLGKRVKLTLLLPQDLPGTVEMLSRLAGVFHVRLVRTQGNLAKLTADCLHELL